MDLGRSILSLCDPRLVVITMRLSLPPGATLPLAAWLLAPLEGLGLPYTRYLWFYWPGIYTVLLVNVLFNLSGRAPNYWISVSLVLGVAVVLQALAVLRPSRLQPHVAGHILVMMVVLAWLARQPESLLGAVYNALLIHTVYHLSLVFALAALYGLPGALVGVLLSAALFPAVQPTDWLIYGLGLLVRTLTGVWANHALRAESAMARRLEHESRTDWLTDLPNRRAFEAALTALRLQPATAAAILVIDLDGFKAINDLYGHAEGDAVLQRIGQALANARQAGESVYRFGGDEFAVLAVPPSTDGLAFAERYRTLVRGVPLPPALSLDLSYGLTLYPAEAPDLDTTWRLADTRMYAHKTARRGAQISA